MVYRCGQCRKALPPGVSACPSCGEKFDDAVPADAEVPKLGFSATATRPPVRPTTRPLVRPVPGLYRDPAPGSPRVPPASPMTVVLWTLFFFPFGLYLLWKHPAWTLKTKTIGTAVYTAAILLISYAGSSSQTSTVPATGQASQPAITVLSAKTAPVAKRASPIKSGDRAGRNAKPATALAPNYTLESSEDCTVDSNQPCRRISIVVPGGQSRAQVALDLTHAVHVAAQSYGCVRGIAFAREEGTDKNGAYSAGRALWGSDEMTDHLYTVDAPAIDYVDSYFKPKAAARPSVARISEDRRKAIYAAIGRSEDRATHEADAAYPTGMGDNAEQIDQAQRNVMPHAKMNSDLIEKYHAEVQQRYHISSNQLSAITLEGVTKFWP